MPSTVANIMDLLQDGKNTVSINNNISWLYIFYQGQLLFAFYIDKRVVCRETAVSYKAANINKSLRHNAHSLSILPQPCFLDKTCLYP